MVLEAVNRSKPVGKAEKEFQGHTFKNEGGIICKRSNFSGFNAKLIDYGKF